jgi:hypothetical protein
MRILYKRVYGAGKRADRFLFSYKERLQDWIRKQKPAFPLLADFEPKGAVSKLYGAYISKEIYL